MKEMKTLKFPNQEEAYEIVDAYAREKIAFLKQMLEILPVEYSDSWRGLISPMDGTFQQAYYNNGVAVGNKIYFIRNYGHSHYNGDNISIPRWFCYDTKTKTTTVSTLPVCDGVQVGGSSMWKGSDGAIYVFGYPYRFKTTDCGVTWTKEEMTTPQYDPCPVYKLSSGRIIGTMLERTKMLMISDNEGLTWKTITPFTDEVFAEAGVTGYISLSHSTICELDDCIALYFNSPMQDDNNASKRYVSLSYDNGDTWSTPVVCSGDLADAGWYISTGGMIYFGNKYHYFVSNRYTNLKYSEDESYYLTGDLKWFVGTANDVKNGTMSLKKVLSQTLCHLNYVNQDNVMARQDVGNSGVTLCDDALYVNHGNLVYNKDDATRVYVSNSGIEMFRIGFTHEEDVEPYWDVNFVDKYNEMFANADRTYNYYFYSPDNTNINMVDWYGYEDTGYLPNKGSFKLPLGTGNFEINGIYNTGYLGLSTDYPRIYGGIEETDGTLHAIGAHRVLNYATFDKANDSSVTSGVLAGGNKTYFTFKRENGVDTYEINGVKVTNPPFGWTFETDEILLGVDEPSYIYNINASDETVQSWIDSSPKSWDVNGLLMLTIRYDTDYQITYDLNKCSSSNAITGIDDGEKYETTISVNDGYRLQSVTCTMGGVAQTVTDGVISIESVTGDIVITAVAIKIVTEPVTSGLTVCYSMDSYNADANTWTDEYGNGTTLTTSSFNTDHNMPAGSAMKAMTMQTFTNLFQNGWSISFPSHVTRANALFSLNAIGGGATHPNGVPYGFEEASGNKFYYDVQNDTVHHYTCTYNSETETYSWYVDGELRGTLPKTTAWNSNTTTYFVLGGWGQRFGDIRMYNRPLTAEEVLQNYMYDGNTWSFDV